MRPKKKIRKRLDEPQLIAGIDVGATSVRMKIAQVETSGTLTPVDELVHPVSLGVDTFRLGYVTAPTLRALCRVLQNFKQTLDEFQVRHYRAVATSAVREAPNKELVLDRIRHAAGIHLQILDGVEESRLIYQVIKPFLKKHGLAGDNHTLLLDLGGGSTETMVLKGTNLVLVSTRRLGTQRLFLNPGSQDGQDAQALLETVIRTVVDSTVQLYQAYSIGSCVVINSLLFRVFERVEGSKRLDGGLEVPLKAILNAVQATDSLSAEGLRQYFHLTAAEVEPIVPAMLILERFLQATGARRVMIVDIDMMSGLLHDLSLRVRGKNPEVAFRGQVIRSAASVGHKFHYDAGHARHVADLALQLFDPLSDLLDLGGKDRLYLEVAAILHEVGMFVSDAAHHKHSEYLIEWAEIVGLNPRERTLVSQIARYHRRATPQLEHVRFASLSADDRLRVTKLAALLRAADALDRAHQKRIERVEIALEEEDLRIRCVCQGDLVVEQAALKEKGALLAEVTGLRLRLQRASP